MPTVRICLPCRERVEIPAEDYKGLKGFRELCTCYCPRKRDPQGCLFYMTRAF